MISDKREQRYEPQPGEPGGPDNDYNQELGSDPIPF